MLGSLQLSHSCSHENSAREGAKHSSQNGDPVEVWKFSLDDIKVRSTPHRRSLFHHLASSMCTLVPVSKDTACGSMFSWN